LLFRDHELADLEAFCEMESDPVYRSPQAVHPRAELERDFQDTWLPPKPMGLLATVCKANCRYIGRCGIYPCRGSDDQIIAGAARLAYYLARPYWGRGFATEASRVFVDYGFRNLNLSRIEAGVNAKNIASIRVLQKLGFKLILSGEGDGNAWHRFELWNPHRPS